jgi:hypothetical protein
MIIPYLPFKPKNLRHTRRHPVDSTFWDVVERTIDCPVHGAAVLAAFFSAIVEAISRKVRDTKTRLSRNVI